MGICPASSDEACEGLNSGHNAGRICWTAAGTFCGGKVQGNFAAKIMSCLECDFFKSVKEDEKQNFKFLLPGKEFQEVEILFWDLVNMSKELERSKEIEMQKAEELRTLNQQLEESQKALLNMMNDLAVAKKKTEELNASLEQRVEERTKELKEATVQLIQSEKLSALGELTAGVAHELNQPLNGIKIIAQSILKDIEKNRFEEEEINRDLTDIVDLVNKMAQIIDHMRIFSRQTEGMTEDLIDINTLVEGPFTFLGQQLRNHNIEVMMELAPDLPKVMGDPIRLEQVLMNLITNARDATESCGKEEKRIEIRTYRADRGQDVVAEVKDNGSGIPEDIRAKIFQPFFTTKQSGKGTGLGLSVSTKIIEEHKGRIEIESKVGEGTTFSVILPVANVNE
jgi:C4-dicarboxylate-specific signal transduction histidine kinase